MKKEAGAELTDEQADKVAAGGPRGELYGELEGNVLTFTCQKCGCLNRITLKYLAQPPCQYCGYINVAGPVGQSGV